MRQRFLRAVLAAAMLACAAPVPAQEAAPSTPTDTSLIRLNARVFDLRVDARDLRLGEGYLFVPLTRVDWIDAALEADPLLARLVIHLEEAPQPVRLTWPSAEPDADYPLTTNLPAPFVVEGYRTRSSHPSNRDLLLTPEGPAQDHFVDCGGPALDQGQAMSCVLYATYPPDPRVRLMARIYFARPPFHFAEIARRLREVAYCLDVTDEIAAGAPLPTDIGPDALADCDDAWASS